MDSSPQWIVPLTDAAEAGETLAGAKAVRLAKLARAGFRVPRGVCVSTSCYEEFVRYNKLENDIRFELGRKPLSAMRWEEIWDAALRIRSRFAAGQLPPGVASVLRETVANLSQNRPLAVRSSARGEDHPGASFAGIHESVVGVTGVEAVISAIQIVWASLWSDAALLYRRELDLDPATSRMAVVIQEVVLEQPSGVAFSRDPRGGKADQAVIESVPGMCAELVDGAVDPDRWFIARSSGMVVRWQAGKRTEAIEPLLERDDLSLLWRALCRVESMLDAPVDIEWTGRAERLTLLQARPITTIQPTQNDARPWYLSLRPAARKLKILAEKVSEQLIPELSKLGEDYALQDLHRFDDNQLADAIVERAAAVECWKRIYWDEFIPLAHGVRHLGLYYNDAVRPDSPYEFVGLLEGQDMLASRRNASIAALAKQLRQYPGAKALLATALNETHDNRFQDVIELLESDAQNSPIADGVKTLFEEFLDITYAGERLVKRPDIVIATLLEMADEDPVDNPRIELPPEETTVAELEERLFRAVGPERIEEAREVIDMGRLSWRLRDDDNVLIGRLESQCLRAIEIGAARLCRAGRLAASVRAGLKDFSIIEKALRKTTNEQVILAPLPAEDAKSVSNSAEGRPRQLIGQPASPGLATGRVKVVRNADDLKRFHSGEVLVCQAIEPTMTHVVPLACAIVERRGGMLIHGAIIARELGVPCVNGVSELLECLEDGDRITVDGYLGIVSVGDPDFELEGVTLN